MGERGHGWEWGQDVRRDRRETPIVGGYPGGHALSEVKVKGDCGRPQ